MQQMIQKWIKRLQRLAYKFGLRNRRLSSVYYAFFYPRFSREHFAVLNGQRLFKSQKRIVSGSSSLLRRNIHRLEKGLIMVPRKDIFALAYIKETVAAYIIAIQKPETESCSNELNWAHDVLVQYFSVCKSHPVIDQCRDSFEQSQPAFHRGQPDRSDTFSPYKRDVLAKPPVSYEQLLELARQRRSVRWFKQIPVPRDLVEKAVHIAGLSPSACNRQPFDFRFFDDPNLLSKVAALPTGTVGFADNFPLIGAVIGNLGHYYDEKDRHVIYIDGGLASMSLLLALETLGLSSCCINWPDIEEREACAQKLLGLSPSERPVMFIAIGYADPEQLVPYSEKKSIQQICRWNKVE